MSPRTRVSVLPGLPTYGEPALSFPEKLGRRGQEGVVVEFGEDDSKWIGNFGGGIGGLTQVLPHPDGKHVLVLKSGDAWVVDPAARTASELGVSVSAIWEFRGDLIMDHQGLAFCRLGPSGIVWHTRRLSWDGFRNVQIVGSELRVDVDTLGQWEERRVDLATGRSSGERLDPAADLDWERLVDE